MVSLPMSAPSAHLCFSSVGAVTWRRFLCQSSEGRMESQSTRLQIHPPKKQTLRNRVSMCSLCSSPLRETLKCKARPPVSTCRPVLHWRGGSTWSARIPLAQGLRLGSRGAATSR